MSHIILPKTLDLTEKVFQMQEDARYDVADAEANAMALGCVRDAIRSKRALPHVPKTFLSNDCAFNCAYCGCRQSNEGRIRYAVTPREMAEVSYKQAMKTGAGIFITSAIHKTPDYTEEQIIQTLKILRGEMGFGGYIHAKIMPGADPALIHEAGLYANRLSVNIEVAHSRGYELIAHNKNRRNILSPMGQISEMISQARQARGRRPRFATSQTTQIMAGSTGEDDFTVLRLSGALYSTYNLARVYYTAFHFTECVQGYETVPHVVTPQWRMHRLYQADRLMQQYGFTADEIAPPAQRTLQEDMDPKAAWALRNMHLFPVEVNRADFETLLRVPGIGLIYAQRILAARRQRKLTHDSLRALGIPLRRCQHFITCDGRFVSGARERIEQLSMFMREDTAVGLAI